MDSIVISADMNGKEYYLMRLSPIEFSYIEDALRFSTEESAKKKINSYFLSLANWIYLNKTIRGIYICIIDGMEIIRRDKFV